MQFLVELFYICYNCFDFGAVHKFPCNYAQDMSAKTIRKKESLQDEKD